MVVVSNHNRPVLVAQDVPSPPPFRVAPVPGRYARGVLEELDQDPEAQDHGGGWFLCVCACVCRDLETGIIMCMYMFV